MTAPKRRWFRFSLRTLFVVIVVMAMPLSQYPYVRFMRTGGRVVALEPSQDGESILIRPLYDPGIYVPTMGCLVAAAVSMILAGGWWWLRRPTHP